MTALSISSTNVDLLPRDNASTGSDNGLAPKSREAIIWTNVGLEADESKSPSLFTVKKVLELIIDVPAHVIWVL